MRHGRRLSPLKCFENITRAGNIMGKLYLAAIVSACAAQLSYAQEPGKIDFVRDVKPLFDAYMTRTRYAC